MAWIFSSNTRMDRRWVISPASLKTFILRTDADLRFLVVSHTAAPLLINCLTFLSGSLNHDFALFAALHHFPLISAKLSDGDYGTHLRSSKARAMTVIMACLKRWHAR